MFKNMKSNINYITLYDMLLNQSANEDPNLFLKSNKPPIIIDEIWNIIHKGTMPALYQEESNFEMFYSTYVNTYIERDVRDLTQVGDTLTFLKFMTALASRIGQLLNLNSVATEVGITVPTAQRCLSILVSSNIVYLLEPYYNNIMKRV